MKHFVFTAGNFLENKKAIDRATHVIAILESEWDMNATVTGVYDGSKFTVNPNDGNNTSICAEDDDIHRLIYSCMAFARENERLKHQ